MNWTHSFPNKYPFNIMSLVDHALINRTEVYIPTFCLRFICKFLDVGN